MRYQILCLALVRVPPVAPACSQATAPAPLRSGVYPLQAYNGKPLPADISIPSKVLPHVPPNVPPEPLSSCQEFVTGGSLTLDVEAGRFSVGYDGWDGCSQALVPQQAVSGTFEQHGNDLVLRVTREIPRIHAAGEWTFNGSAGPSSITLAVFGGVQFQR